MLRFIDLPKNCILCSKTIDEETYEISELKMCHAWIIETVDDRLLEVIVEGKGKYVQKYSESSKILPVGSEPLKFIGTSLVAVDRAIEDYIEEERISLEKSIESYQKDIRQLNRYIKNCENKLKKLENK